MNLLDLIEHDREHAAQLAHWWREFVQRTWGRPEMKARERFVALAEELAPQVPASVRDLFLVGTGVRPGAWELAVPALEKFDSRVLDPTQYLPRVRVPVALVHGTTDDVIPFEQTEALARGLTNTRVKVHITGLYDHTKSQRPPLSALARELLTMTRVLRTLAG
jgi:pimeloyl-ACP methyl ester carboxylesterase